MSPALRCFHCGEPVPEATDFSVTIHQRAQPMCCIGCASIAQAIVDAGALAYYDQREGTGLDIKTLESLAPWAQLFNDPQWSAQHVQTSHETAQPSSEIAQATLAVEGLRCGACSWLIERMLGAEDGVLTVRANSSNARVFLKWLPDRTNLETLAKRINQIGYALLPIGSAPVEAARQRTERLALRRLFVAGLSSAQVMMYAYPEYMEGGGLDDEVRLLMRTASMLITVPVMVYSATPFFESAWRMLKSRRLGMDVPVSLGLIIAFAASMLAWAMNEGEIYFDSVSMFVFLLLGTRWIESRIRAKSSAQRERLATALPSLADRIAPDPGRVAAWNLRPGDRIRVASGARIPADGVLCSRTTDLDTSWLTGESLPVPATYGDRIAEGTINLGPEIELSIQNDVAQGTLARLSQLAEQAAADRPQWVTWADQIGARFTAGILIVTATLALGATLLNVPVSVWLASVIAVLVVTCPCALSMSGPAAYAAALARLLEDGIAVSTAGTLERAKSVTDVVFDKTGTLTDPSASSVTMRFGETELWSWAYALAKESSHPLARAIAAKALSTIPDQAPVNDPNRSNDQTATDVTQHAGLGLTGRINGQDVQLGSLSFTDPAGQSVDRSRLHPRCTVFLSISGQLRAGFEINDQARPELPHLLEGLRQQGLTIWCLSGDREDRVADFVASIGLDPRHALGGQTPEMKQRFAASLQSEGRVVAMVGDGHNDAPVLAQADVSLALQGAAPLAQQKADIYLLRPGLHGVGETFQQAKRAGRVLNQNLGWALIYNVVAIPFAVAGWISPLLASVGMATSSLVVVLNSARLLR